ncbi:MAG: LysM peptidoglycan-binding domain-containing protein [Candidatus Thorarchaeota archaeon]
MRKKCTKVLIIIGLAVIQMLFMTAAVPVHPLTSYDVIAAVNALRASYGLPHYAVDNLLMLAAQGQADYLASIAPNVGDGHVGLGRTDADARALAVGYPYVEGLDINENWAGIPLGTSIEILITTGWSDDAHMHTMLHERGQHIGAGVAVSGSTAYIVMDVAAYWGDAGLIQQPVNSSSETGLSGEQVVLNFIAPVVKADPSDDGSIVHLVQSGQSLWMLAHHYEVDIDHLKQINHLGTSDVIFIGQDILIQQPLPATDTPETLSSVATLSSTATGLQTIKTAVPTQTLEQNEEKTDDSNWYLLLFFAVFWIGFILVIIGTQR